ncbi:MAG: flagellar hook-basal body complex protein FliE [Nocardioidaceae bacterium]|nr:flagellar hook-basal body complex protein FliE [Nocardioidaceae bacterium]
MSVSGIEGVGFTPMVAPTVQTPTVNKPSDAGGTDFGSLVVDGLDRIEQVNDKAADLSVRAATGDLDAIHDYTIAATEAQVTTQLTVALRNKAVDAFNEIMRMQV